MTQRTSWRMPFLAAAVLIAGAAAGGGTMALWKTAGQAAPVTIVAGDLEVTSGDTTWTETSSDVADSGAMIDPDTFLVRRGDTVEMSQEFTTRIDGDNMGARIGVDWVDPAELPKGVTADFEVRDASGERLGARTPVGKRLTLDADDELLVAGETGRDDSFTVAVTLDFAKLSDRFGADSPVQIADLGRFAFTLDQERETGGTP